MSIMMVTSLSSLTKNLEMRMRWQKRQEEGDYAPDTTSPPDNTFKKQVDDMRYPEYDRSSRMEGDIEIKLTAGKELTSQEMNYLKKHNPGTYQKAKIIERERKSYEKSLESCSTKEEVEQLKASHAEAAVNRVRSILKNTYLSREQKQELLQMEHYKAAALDDAMHEFIDTPEYKTLPDTLLPAKDKDKAEGVQNTVLDLNAVSGQEPAKEAKDAAEYEIPKQEEEKKPAVPESSADDAAEEGTIMKAILDEEARWAKAEQENAGNGDPSSSLAEEGLDIFGAMQQKAQAAYLLAQTFPGETDTSAVSLNL